MTACAANLGFISNILWPYEPDRALCVLKVPVSQPLYLRAQVSWSWNQGVYVDENHLAGCCDSFFDKLGSRQVLCDDVKKRWNRSDGEKAPRICRGAS